MMPPFDNGKENKDETERAKGDNTPFSTFLQM